MSRSDDRFEAVTAAESVFADERARSAADPDEITRTRSRKCGLATPFVSDRYLPPTMLLYGRLTTGKKSLDYLVILDKSGLGAIIPLRVSSSSSVRG